MGGYGGTGGSVRIGEPLPGGTPGLVLQVGAGPVVAQSGAVPLANGSAGAPSVFFTNLPTSGLFCIPASAGDVDVSIAGTCVARFLGGSLRLASGMGVTWSSGDPTLVGADTGLFRLAPGVAAFQSGAAPQEVRVYGNATKYVSILHDATDAYLNASSGNVYLHSGVTYVLLTTAGHFLPYTNNLQDFGTGGQQWRNGYISTSLNLSGDGGLKLTNQTNYAAAQAGTLLNAPTAGNPAKWLPIYSDGVLYKFPCWA